MLSCGRCTLDDVKANPSHYINSTFAVYNQNIIRKYPIPVAYEMIYKIL